jgi:hypothetical protein
LLSPLLSIKRDDPTKPKGEALPLERTLPSRSVLVAHRARIAVVRHLHATGTRLNLVLNQAAVQ